MSTFHPEDRVAVLSTTSGTGPFTFTATPPKSYITPATAGYVVGDTFDGRIIAPDGTGWLSGKMQLATSTSISILTVYANSLGTTALISFNNSNKTILIDMPAKKIKMLYGWAFTDGTYF